MPDPPATDEGWFVLHDFRTVDWDAWRSASEAERERAVATGAAFLADSEAVDAVESPENEGAGTSAVCSVLGDDADLLVLHFRPTLDQLSALERRFEATPFAAYTDRVDSYVSVTEVSGYVSDAYFDEEQETDSGVERYIQGKLHPEIPDGEYVSFYPMSKRRGETHNWYALEHDERADLMAEHGDTGREFAGRVSQVISSSVGFDDFEWGVTLFAPDPTDIKDIVYEMRFDAATALYGEFGAFRVGRRFPPSDLGAYLDGEQVPTGEGASETDGEAASPHGEDGHAGHGSDDPPAAHGGDSEGSSGDAGHAHGGADEIRGELADMDVYAGQPHGEDVFAAVVYSDAGVDELFEETDGLRANFDHYDTHVETSVYEARDGSRAAVASLWDTASAAETAAGFLADLPGVVSRAGEEEGFGTMGMFYTVKPDYREEFHEKFDTVLEVLNETEGHVETDLMVNYEDANDAFIASQWDSQDDAMGFFRSEAFQDTVDWGRDVLADRPRHVFLA